MDNKIVEFRGIERNSDVEIAKDGGAVDLINLRPREDGALEPIGEPLVVANVDGYTPLYIHETSTAHNVISLQKGGNFICLSHYRESANDKFKEWTSSDGLLMIFERDVRAGDVSVHASGNTLIIDVKDGDKADTAYFVYYPKDGYVRQVIPSEIALSVSADSTTHEAVFTLGNNGGKYELKAGEMHSYINATKAEALQKGKTCEAVLFMAALRLFDGSYLHPSRIVEVKPSGNVEVLINRILDSEHKIKVSVPCIETLHIQAVPLIYNTDWKQCALIQGVDVFAFRYDPYALKAPKIEANGNEETVTYDSLTDMGLSADEIADIMLHGGKIREIQPLIPSNGVLSKANAFYLIASSDARSNYELRLHTTREGEMLFAGANASEGPSRKCALFEPIDRFVQNDRIDWSKVIPIKRLSGNRYIFNRRTHLYNIDAFVDAAEVSTLSGVGTAYLSMHNGDVVTIENAHSVVGQYVYTAIPGAKSIVIKSVVEYGLQGGANLARYVVYDLKPHKYLPISYATGATFGTSLPIGGGHEDAVISAIRAQAKPFLHWDNVVKCSMSDNPLGFTSLLTYPTAGSVVGLSSVPSSPEGYNFGEYPVYVFTTSGIYALMQGNGEVAYSALRYVSSDVLSNHNALCPTPFGLAYSSAGHIYLMQSDGHREKISYHLESATKDIQGEVFSQMYSILTKEAKTDTTMPFLRETFGDISDCAHIEYSHRTEDLIVHTHTPHCLVYNMRSKRWCRRSVSISRSYLVGSQLLFSDTKSPAFLFDWENRTHTNATVLLLTRPFSFGHSGYNRVGVVALRGLFLSSDIHPSVGDNQISFNGNIIHRNEALRAYLFASDDGVEYKAIEAKNVHNLRDIRFTPPRSNSHRFFCVAVFGAVKNGTRINYIELETDKAYDNKIR